MKSSLIIAVFLGLLTTDASATKLTGPYHHSQIHDEKDDDGKEVTGKDSAEANAMYYKQKEFKDEVAQQKEKEDTKTPHEKRMEAEKNNKKI